MPISAAQAGAVFSTPWCQGVSSSKTRTSAPSNGFAGAALSDVGEAGAAVGVGAQDANIPIKNTPIRRADTILRVNMIFSFYAFGSVFFMEGLTTWIS
jgi:hypothetical protein